MPPAKPTILIFSTSGLDGGLKKMSAQADLHQASFQTPSEPLHLLRAHPIARALWLADAEITTPAYAQLSQEVVDYTRRGGITVLGGFFAETVAPKAFDAWMQRAWELPWKQGQYVRTTVGLRRSAKGPHFRGRAWREGLLGEYSAKAVFLTGVEVGDVWYAAPEGATSESGVFGQVPVEALPAVVYARVGDGWLGYVGDVNGEEGSARVLLAMMGLDPRD